MSHKRRILTGITTSGTPHLGNYVGAIRPAIAASHRPDAESFFFLADYHALIKTGDPARVQQSTLEIAASWLACGLDPDKVFFYRQSDIPEIPELTWLLTCVTAKGLLNRAHAYKAAVDQNSANGEDPDAGISAGLYMYPVLMAADILIFNAHEVPVGRDQVQHIEMARDIAQRFNHIYAQRLILSQTPPFTLPEARIEESVATLPGTDGRKMSKSYGNTIPLWLPADELRKAILGIVTDSRAPGEAKDPDGSNIFAIYQAFATADETAAMRQAYAEGIGWGDAKQKLFERIDAELANPRERYRGLIANPQSIEDRLCQGADKACKRSKDLIEKLRWVVGISAVNSSSSMPQSMGPSDTPDPATSRGAAQIKSYRETNGKFHFKLLDAQGDAVFTSCGFDSPKDAAQMMDVLVSEGDQLTGDNWALVRSTSAGSIEWQVNSDRIKIALAAIKQARLAKERAKSN